jgi:hypothetical protein
MYSVLAENGLVDVVATASLGASPVPEIPNIGPFSKENAYYWSGVLPTLISQLNEGDIVILLNDLAGYAPATMSTLVQGNIASLRTGSDGRGTR